MKTNTANSKTRYYLSAKLASAEASPDLIEIGIISEDDHSLHLGNKDCACNIALNLPVMAEPFWMHRDGIISLVLEFFGYEWIDGVGEYCLDFGKEIEVWSDCSPLEWAALCQLFETMMNLPSRFIMNAEISEGMSPPKEGADYNALEEAKALKKLLLSL